MAAMFSSASEEWATPDDLFRELDRAFRFTLDVAATYENRKCDRYFNRETDGLTQEWRGRIWCNPPYGRRVGEWLKKARQEVDAGRSDVAVFLLPARTDTKWFHQWIWDQTQHQARPGVELRLVPGRLKFKGAATSAPFPSLIAVLTTHHHDSLGTNGD